MHRRRILAYSLNVVYSVTTFLVVKMQRTADREIRRLCKYVGMCQVGCESYSVQQLRKIVVEHRL